MNLDDPTEAALAATELLRAHGIRHALYGGLALAAYGEPRETRDVDLAVLESRTAGVLSLMSTAGWSVAQAFESVTFGGLQLSRITLLGRAGDTGLNVLDLVAPRSARYAEQALARALAAPLLGKEITILGPEDFVLFKVLSSRDRDVHDAASVLRRSGSQIDRSLIDAEVQHLRREIPDHEVAGRWEEVQRLAGEPD